MRQERTGPKAILVRGLARLLFRRVSVPHLRRSGTGAPAL